MATLALLIPDYRLHLYSLKFKRTGINGAAVQIQYVLKETTHKKLHQDFNLNNDFQPVEEIVSIFCENIFKEQKLV